MTYAYDLPPELRVEADGPVRTVILNRPTELNAINRSLHRALAIVWAQLSADLDARVVILTGAGRSFSAGGDLDWISSFPHDPVARDDSLREGAQIIEEILRFPLPVIGAVNGAAVGLGCSLAVLCDAALISERAFLADPHVSVGLVAGDGGAAFWPLLTPILRSRHYLYTGDRIPAAEAVELGLATRAVAPEDLLPEARRLAGRLAQQPGGGAARHQTSRQHAPVAGPQRRHAGRVRRRGGHHAVGRAPRAAGGAARGCGGPSSGRPARRAAAAVTAAATAAGLEEFRAAVPSGARPTCRPAGGSRRPVRATIQRTIIDERGLGLPRDAAAGSSRSPGRAEEVGLSFGGAR